VIDAGAMSGAMSGAMLHACVGMLEVRESLDMPTQAWSMAPRFFAPVYLFLIADYT
jgi:hypothetical protein